MVCSKIESAIAVSNVELARRHSKPEPGYVGRVSFCVNGFVWFCRLPVRREGRDIRLDCAMAALCPMPPHIEEAIERLVVAQLREVLA